MHNKRVPWNLNRGNAEASIKEKSVIFVGPAPSLQGQQQGKIIDNYDIVVRTNGGFKLSDRHPLDYGSKCDVLYINNFWCKHNLLDHQNYFETHDIRFLGVKLKTAMGLLGKVPNHSGLFKSNMPKFFLGGEIPKDNKLRKLWIRKKKNVRPPEPMQATNIILDMLNFGAKKITITGIDFYQGKACWHKDYNGLEVKPKAHASRRSLQHNPTGDRRYIKLHLMKNNIDADVKIKQILKLADLELPFSVPSS